MRLEAGEVLGPPLSKPMSSVGRGASELRIKDDKNSVRVFYYVKHAEAILVFHAFGKKSSKTPKREIETGKKRLKEMLDAG